jgi:putative transposase
MSDEGLAVKTACRALEVTTAGFYEWRTRPLSPRAIRRVWLADVIREVHSTSRGVYGAPRVHAELRLGRGIIVGHNLIARIMRDEGLAGLPARKRFRRPGESVTAIDLVDRCFARDEPDRLWVTDITEHPTGEGKLYLCAIKDVFSNRIVGWSIDGRMKARLVVAAIEMAVARRGEVAGCILQSDRGSQFRARKVQRALTRHRTVGSMGQVGSTGDNAAMESFFALLQRNVLDRHRWNSRDELRIAIVTWIERTYHPRRRQAALGRLTPIEYEMIKTPPAAQAA